MFDPRRWWERPGREGKARLGRRFLPSRPVTFEVGVTRRYRERIEVATGGTGVSLASAGQADPVPTGFRWRGRSYHVLTVLGHWREDAGYWTGGGVEIPQRDLWRVEAADTAGIGVYELVCEAGSWLLDRVWD